MNGLIPNLGKRLRLYVLRRLVRHYSQCVDLPFDRAASARLDAALFLLESEKGGGQE